MTPEQIKALIALKEEYLATLDDAEEDDTPPA